MGFVTHIYFSLYMQLSCIFLVPGLLLKAAEQEQRHAEWISCITSINVQVIKGHEKKEKNQTTNASWKRSPYSVPGVLAMHKDKDRCCNNLVLMSHQTGTGIQTKGKMVCGGFCHT